MVLIESLMKIFLNWIEMGSNRSVEVDNLFNSMWKLLYNLSGKPEVTSEPKVKLYLKSINVFIFINFTKINRKIVPNFA